MSEGLTFEHLKSITSQLGATVDDKYSLIVSWATSRWIDDTSRFCETCYDWSRKRKLKWFRRRNKQHMKEDASEVKSAPSFRPLL
jgi:predicted DCC family thiol-disulfide oxidoreductase YuxK